MNLVDLENAGEYLCMVTFALVHALTQNNSVIICLRNLQKSGLLYLTMITTSVKQTDRQAPMGARSGREAAKQTIIRPKRLCAKVKIGRTKVPPPPPPPISTALAWNIYIL